VALGTSLNNVSDQLIRKMHRQNDDFGLRETLANFARRFDSVQFGRSDVPRSFWRAQIGLLGGRPTYDDGVLSMEIGRFQNLTRPHAGKCICLVAIPSRVHFREDPASNWVNSTVASKCSEYPKVSYRHRWGRHDDVGGSALPLSESGLRVRN
jgi:hypothetical protein